MLVDGYSMFEILPPNGEQENKKKPPRYHNGAAKKMKQTFYKVQIICLS